MMVGSHSLGLFFVIEKIQLEENSKSVFADFLNINELQLVLPFETDTN